jgi:hypothetical protein
VKARIEVPEGMDLPPVRLKDKIISPEADRKIIVIRP